MMRLIPTSLYNVPAMETWLRDQARRGLRLTGFLGECFALFEKEEPQEAVYRLEVSGRGYHPDEEERALYAATGWDYVGVTYPEDFWVFRSARSDPAPIHTDPEVQALGYRRLERRLRRRMAAWAVLAAVWVVLTAVWLWVLSGYVRQLAADPGLPLMNNAFWILGLTLYYLILRSCDLLALRRLTRTLRAGVSTEHRGRVPALRRWGFRGMVLLMAAYCLLMFTSIAVYDRDRTFLDWKGPLSDCPEPLPCVFVEELGAVSQKPSPSAVG